MNIASRIIRKAILYSTDMLFSFLATVVCIVCVVQAGLYKEPSESVYGFVKDEDHSEIEEAYEVVSVEESPVEMKQELQFPESSLITGYHDGRAVPMEKPKQDDFVDKQKEALPAERTAPKSEYTPERVEDIFQVDGQYSMNNQLNDYPPNKLMTFPLERASRVYPPAKHPDTYAPPGVPYGLPQPVHPLMYRGYPYVYGYPFDYRFGYAYGHAFGSDGKYTYFIPEIYMRI